MRFAFMLQKQCLAQRGRTLLDQPDRFACAADAEHLMAATAGAFHDLARLGIIGPNHRRLAGWKKLVEQPHLGLEIAVHRFVIVEVIAAEVGEGSGA